METSMWVMLGVESLALVLLNSVFVAVSASLMFRVKEVMPKGKSRVVFWKEDLKAVRNLRKTEHKAREEKR
jgi:hypothetical protein